MKTTGFSSRIALLMSPLASCGVAGATTFKPGTWQNHASRLCECWAANWCAAEPGPRITIGTQSCPPDMRSEEHTSELQSRLHLVCRLLLEKKKTTSNSSNLRRKGKASTL